jgi:hypothetical protein
MKTVLDKIQELYRANTVWNGNLNAMDFKYDEKNEDSPGNKYDLSEMEPNELLTPESSLMSFT